MTIPPRPLLRCCALIALLAAGAGCPRPATRPIANLPPPPGPPIPCWDRGAAELVARQTVADLLGAPWLARFRAQRGRAPVLRLMPLHNRSVEPIDGVYFGARIEAELIRAGQVKIVGANGETRPERADQARHAADGSAKQEQRELGADFLLGGWIVSADDEDRGRTLRSFVTTLELTSVGSNEKPWMKVHRVRRLVIAR